MHRDKAFSGDPNEAFKEAMWFLVEQKHPGNTFQTWVGHWAALNLAPCLRHRPPGSLRTSVPSCTELPPLLTNEVPSQGRGCTASWGLPVIWQSAEITCANFLSLFRMAVSTPRWDNVEISDGKRNGVPGSPLHTSQPFPLLSPSHSRWIDLVLPSHSATFWPKSFASFRIQWKSSPTGLRIKPYWSLW